MRSVYGGFIGEKLSQDSPETAWRKLQKLGVTQLIDLRYNYNSEKFKDRCEEYGISYYNYPIHNDPETIANMVENYSRFTELLCNGDFYMQGQSSSYVALCLYWTFSKCPGLYPYELRREIKQNRALMKRVAPILHAIYKFEEERYGNAAYLTANYLDLRKEQIRDFLDNDGPKKVSYSIFDFCRDYRNETTVYDIFIQSIGTVGYLYAPKHNGGLWEYDIVMRPSVSDEAFSFADAQINIASYLCDILPHSIKWAALPESVKKSVFILRASLEHNIF